MFDKTCLALACLCALAACHPGERSGPLHASGHIEATAVRLAAPMAGILRELPFQEGEKVEAGQVVARMDTAILEQEVEQARAERDAAQAKLALLFAGARPEELAEARARLAAVEAELAAAQADLARYTPLAERGSASRKLRDDAATRAAVAQEQCNALRARLAQLLAGPRAEEVALAQARLRAAEAALGILTQRLADAKVRSPIAGYVTARVAEPGEFLLAGAPLLVVADLARPWLAVFLDEPSLSRVHLGDPVRVRLDGHKESIVGKVSFIAQQAEFTPKNVQTPEERAKLVFRVEISLPNPGLVLKPGMPADAYFDREREHERSPLP